MWVIGDFRGKTVTVNSKKPGRCVGKGMTNILKTRRHKLTRGQSLVEVALLLPLILMLLSSLVEFGFGLLDYLGIQDATRNAARFVSDSAYNNRDSIMSCQSTQDFYRFTACLVNQELRQERPLVHMNDNGTPNDFTDDYLDPAHGDDIIVSVFGVVQGTGVVTRFPAAVGDQGGEKGWSYALDLTTNRNASSAFTSANVTSMWLNTDIAYAHITPTPDTGLVIVEVYYKYDQKLKLPWLTAFVPDPIPFHFYTIMNLASAEPTPTPAP
jgi:hypothetical protein